MAPRPTAAIDPPSADDHAAAPRRESNVAEDSATPARAPSRAADAPPPSSRAHDGAPESTHRAVPAGPDETDRTPDAHVSAPVFAAAPAQSNDVADHAPQPADVASVVAVTNGHATFEVPQPANAPRRRGASPRTRPVSVESHQRLRLEGWTFESVAADSELVAPSEATRSARHEPSQPGQASANVRHSSSTQRDRTARSETRGEESVGRTLLVEREAARVDAAPTASVQLTIDSTNHRESSATERAPVRGARGTHDERPDVTPTLAAPEEAEPGERRAVRANAMHVAAPQRAGGETPDREAAIRGVRARREVELDAADGFSLLGFDPRSRHPTAAARHQATRTSDERRAARIIIEQVDVTAEPTPAATPEPGPSLTLEAYLAGKGGSR